MRKKHGKGRKPHRPAEPVRDLPGLWMRKASALRSAAATTNAGSARLMTRAVQLDECAADLIAAIKAGRGGPDA